MRIEPDQRAEHDQERCKRGNTAEDVLNHAEPLVLRLPVAIGHADVLEVERDVLGNLGMLREKLTQGRIRRKIALVPHEGRVELEHARNRRRVLAEHLDELVPRGRRVHLSDRWRRLLRGGLDGPALGLRLRGVTR